MKIERCEKRGRRLECNLKIGVREEKEEKLRLRLRRQFLTIERDSVCVTHFSFLSSLQGTK